MSRPRSASVDALLAGSQVMRIFYCSYGYLNRQMWRGTGECWLTEFERIHSICLSGRHHLGQNAKFILWLKCSYRYPIELAHHDVRIELPRRPALLQIHAFEGRHRYGVRMTDRLTGHGNSSSNWPEIVADAITASARPRHTCTGRVALRVHRRCRRKAGPSVRLARKRQLLLAAGHRAAGHCGSRRNRLRQSAEAADALKKCSAYAQHRQ
jgi:hypothetical protein